MFVPTLFWVDESSLQFKTPNEAQNVTYYCTDRVTANGGPTPDTCNPVSASDIATFQAGMQACFQAAVNQGLSIAITPHLDDGLGLGGWRNGLRFDPLEKYGDYSYVDFMLYPLADALNAVLQEDTEVDFGMQGEMSATVFYYPNSYIDIIPILRQRVLAGKPSSWSSNIRIGTSTNFNKLCGCVLVNLVDPSEYLSLYPAAFAPLKSEFDLNAIQQLYSDIDFIGISSYASNTPDFTIDKLESATYQFATEIASFGVDIPDLIFNQGKKLYWNEYGVGGGTNQNGQVPATTAAEAAATPFFGVFGTYACDTDPWQLCDGPNVNGPLSYLEYFFNMTVAYVNSGGKGSPDCPGCQYRTDGVFLWNDASWDFQALYPESTSSQGSYRIPFLVDLLNEHNSQVIGSSQQSSRSAGSTAGRRKMLRA
ncbi:hypothetical protein WJX73_003263 [Symbiochloris irregularis]|uniref:Uncharacterized protein n=1 Tax=Symbiochloris irregularis TaxID=706552 RepID=A0AAW1NFD1_9CHLO